MQPVQHEMYRRMASFDPSIPNPAVGGLPGGIRFEGSGPGRCNCTFASAYPYALGPRIGVAWQVLPKTVLRIGWAISYSRGAAQITTSAYSPGFGFNTLASNNPGAGRPAFLLKDGIPYQLADLFANSQNPGLRPSATATRLSSSATRITAPWGPWAAWDTGERCGPFLRRIRGKPRAN